MKTPDLGQPAAVNPFRIRLTVTANFTLKALENVGARQLIFFSAGNLIIEQIMFPKRTKSYFQS